MRLQRLELPGFGCLSDFRTELSPGLNVFHGENEAGKSTLQAAISALLYGFFENERALKNESERYNRFRPWAGGLYRGSLEYELSSGDRFEVRRDFADDVATQLIDGATGLDVSPQFGRGRHGNVPFARRHIGMSRGVFQSCAFISQGEIFAATQGASPSEIGDAVAALADSARRDVSAARAIERLDAALSRIGSDRARTAELPKARARLERAQQELSEGEEARARAAQTARRLEEVRTEIRSLQQRRAETEVLTRKAQKAGLQTWLDAVSAAAEEAEQARAEADSLSAYAGFPASIRDELIALEGRRSSISDGLDRLRAEQSQAESEITADERLEYETLRESAGALTDEQVRSLREAAFQRRPRIVAFIAKVLRAIGRAVVRAVRWGLRKEPLPTPEPAFSASPEEARGLLDRYHRYLSLRPRVDAIQRLAAEVAGQEATLATIESQLRGLLASAGITDEDIDRALAAFEEAARGRERYRRAAGAADEAERRHKAAVGDHTPEDIEDRLEECTRALTELLARRPELDDLEPDRPLEQLKEERDHLREDLQEAQLRERGLDEELRLVLERHRPAAELEEEAARWRREVARLEKARAALTLARTVIEEAMVQVYRDFAPAVNTFLSEGIEYVTEGRYTRAHVDPASLKVSLLVPETGQVITDPPVSQGTRTMVYVLMRVGLAQHMSAIGEPVPLVLDDPFVDVDARRLPRMMHFLLELSERMQVLFFTKEEAIVRWFEENAVTPEHSLHRLTETRLRQAIV